MKSDADCHIAAAAVAALINFPLWRASAIAQSGFKLEGSSTFQKYYKAVVQPPFKGAFATMAGMTWARAFIFFGSDIGNIYIENRISNLICFHREKIFEGKKSKWNSILYITSTDHKHFSSNCKHATY